MSWWPGNLRDPHRFFSMPVGSDSLIVGKNDFMTKNPNLIIRGSKGKTSSRFFFHCSCQSGFVCDLLSQVLWDFNQIVTSNQPLPLISHWVKCIKWYSFPGRSFWQFWGSRRDAFEPIGCASSWMMKRRNSRKSPSKFTFWLLEINKLSWDIGDSLIDKPILRRWFFLKTCRWENPSTEWSWNMIPRPQTMHNFNRQTLQNDHRFATCLIPLPQMSLMFNDPWTQLYLQKHPRVTTKNLPKVPGAPILLDTKVSFKSNPATWAVIYAVHPW